MKELESFEDHSNLGSGKYALWESLVGSKVVNEVPKKYFASSISRPGSTLSWEISHIRRCVAVHCRAVSSGPVWRPESYAWFQTPELRCSKERNCRFCGAAFPPLLCPCPWGHACSGLELLRLKKDRDYAMSWTRDTGVASAPHRDRDPPWDVSVPFDRSKCSDLTS